MSLATLWCLLLFSWFCVSRGQNDAEKGDQSSDSDKTPMIILPVLVVVVIIILVILYIKRRSVILCLRNRNGNPVQPDNDDTGHHSEPSYAEQDDYITPISPDYFPQNATLPTTAPLEGGLALASSDYVTVIADDSIASNRDCSYNYPTFTVSHEYDQLPNDYDRLSDIFTPTSDY